MKEELMQLGFTEVISKVHEGGIHPNFLELKKKGFAINFCLEGHFFISPDGAGDEEAGLYPYRGIDKLQKLIEAHEQYFN